MPRLFTIRLESAEIFRHAIKSRGPTVSCHVQVTSLNALFATDYCMILVDSFTIFQSLGASSFAKPVNYYLAKSKAKRTLFLAFMDFFNFSKSKPTSPQAAPKAVQKVQVSRSVKPASQPKSHLTLPPEQRSREPKSTPRPVAPPVKANQARRGGEAQGIPKRKSKSPSISVLAEDSEGDSDDEAIARSQKRVRHHDTSVIDRKRTIRDLDKWSDNDNDDFVFTHGEYLTSCAKEGDFAPVFDSESTGPLRVSLRYPNAVQEERYA